MQFLGAPADNEHLHTPQQQQQQTYKLRIYFNCKLFLNDAQVLVQLSYWIENVFMFPHIIVEQLNAVKWTMNGRTAMPIYCTVWTNDGVAVRFAWIGRLFISIIRDIDVYVSTPYSISTLCV